MTSHHVWVLLESHKPVSSALDHVGATGAMVRGYRGLDHGIMGHGVVGHPGLSCKMLQVELCEMSISRIYDVY